MTAIFAIELEKHDIPVLFESNVAKNEFGKMFDLDPKTFSLGDLPQLAQDTATNEAVIATSPDGGRVGDTSQRNSGAGIANDPVNGLFLVTDPSYCSGSQGSAIVVYDEKGNLVGTITGFKLALGEPAPAMVSAKRMG